MSSAWLMTTTARARRNFICWTGTTIFVKKNVCRYHLKAIHADQYCGEQGG